MENIINSIIYIFNFTACPNAWYLEMYIGLFLLIPFLNIIYNNNFGVLWPAFF